MREVKRRGDPCFTVKSVTLNWAVRNRPVPAGRLKPLEALIFGMITTVVGIGYLWNAVNPLSATVTGAITVLYLGAYTPMKRYSWMCHVVGAVPGALPPVIGWAAARGSGRECER